MGQFFSNEQIKNIIIDIESRWPVERWTVNEIDVWPYIRNKIYIFLLNYKREEFLTTLEEQNPNHRSSFSIHKEFRKIRKVLHAFFGFKRFYGSLEKKELIFFGSSFQRTKYKRLYFNRLFDPIIDFHNLHSKVYVFENSRILKEVYNSEVVIPFKKYLDFHDVLEKLKVKLKSKEVKDSLDGYEEFYNFFTNSFPDGKSLKISRKEVVNWALRIGRISIFFSKVFAKTKPKKIIMLSYNAYDDFYAAIFAAHKQKIVVIDFQHGFQTNLHMVYSHWTKFPGRAYNSLPNVYWNWDENSKLNIEKWAYRGKVSTRVVGHPYLRYWIEKSEKTNSPYKTIFYSLGLQPLNELFPDKLLKIIKSSSTQWNMRMHPRSNFSEVDVSNYLVNSNISLEKFNIQNAFDLPLPQTLANSHLHITNFSGCLIEAKMMGVPSIIIHSSGRDFFKNYIDNYLVYYIPVSETGFENKFDATLHTVLKQQFNSVIGPIVNPLQEEIE